jgi:predicted 3-demethylubiquinone-9 3-methyltransferase (glyoxalase superfamily)
MSVVAQHLVQRDVPVDIRERITSMQRTMPCLWFPGNADDAVRHYQSIFRDSEIINITYTPEGAPGEHGNALMIHFRLNDLELLALNAPHDMAFNETMSLVVDVQDQAELDAYWDGLIADGGEESMCGWCKDKFGVSWQVVPAFFTQTILNGSADAVTRMTNAMLPMKKLDIATLVDAAEGKDAT